MFARCCSHAVIACDLPNPWRINVVIGPSWCRLMVAIRPKAFADEIDAHRQVPRILVRCRDSGVSRF